jgi:hypothetical protein
MAVPLVALVLACGLGVRDRMRSADDAQEQVDIVEAVRSVDDLLDALQLERQLAFITRLESGETDSDRIAGLFEVDHRATRMRPQR